MMAVTSAEKVILSNAKLARPVALLYWPGARKPGAKFGSDTWPLFDPLVEQMKVVKR